MKTPSEEQELRELRRGEPEKMWMNGGGHRLCPFCGPAPGRCVLCSPESSGLGGNDREIDLSSQSLNEITARGLCPSHRCSQVSWSMCRAACGIILPQRDPSGSLSWWHLCPVAPEHCHLQKSPPYAVPMVGISACGFEFS